MAPTSVPPPERHFGYVCSNCNASGFAGRRYACWVCSDYQICGNCYDAGQFPVRPEHKYFHPLETHYTRAEYELYFGGETYVETNVPQSYKCALCDVCGLTHIELYSHLSEMHRGHIDFFEYSNIFLRRFAAEPTMFRTNATAAGNAGAGAGGVSGSVGSVAGPVVARTGAGAGAGARARAGARVGAGGGSRVRTVGGGDEAGNGGRNLEGGRPAAGVGAGDGIGAGTGARTRARAGAGTGAGARFSGRSGGSARRSGAAGLVDRGASARTRSGEFHFDFLFPSIGGSHSLDLQRNGSHHRRYAGNNSTAGSSAAYRSFLGRDFFSDDVARPASQRNSMMTSETGPGISRTRESSGPGHSSGSAGTVGGDIWLDAAALFPSSDGSLRRNDGNDLASRTFAGYIPFSELEFFSDIVSRPQSQSMTLRPPQRSTRQQQQQLQRPRHQEHFILEQRYVERLNMCAHHLSSRKDKSQKNGSKRRDKAKICRYLCSTFITQEQAQQYCIQPPESNRVLFIEALLCSMLADDQLNLEPADGRSNAELLLDSAAAPKTVLAVKYLDEPCDHVVVGGDVDVCPAGRAGIMDRFYKKLDLYNNWLADFSNKKRDQGSEMATIPDVMTLLAAPNPVAGGNIVELFDNNEGPGQNKPEDEKEKHVTFNIIVTDSEQQQDVEDEVGVELNVDVDVEVGVDVDVDVVVEEDMGEAEDGDEAEDGNDENVAGSEDDGEAECEAEAGGVCDGEDEEENDYEEHAGH